FAHIAAILFFFGSAISAHAGLLNRTLDAQYFFPDTSTPYGLSSATPSTFVVGAGIETTFDVEGVTQIVTDFGDTSLRFDFVTILSTPTWNPAAFNGVIFNRLAGASLSLLSASIDPISTMSGFDASRVTFNDNQIAINWNGLSYINGTTLLINFVSAPNSVPEPGTTALLVLGLFSIFIGRRKMEKGGKPHTVRL
ncbi:MAG: PEP-CTERM sorting domain-containing protein, partial [Oxalobacteraceae bacterium]